MKIYCEDSLLYATEFFCDWGEVCLFSGRSVKPEDIQDADVLLVRSTTTVNQSLIGKCEKLQFVGTGTAGFNHLGTDYLDHRRIPWSAAPGCNAQAVAEYVISALFAQAQKFNWQLSEKRVGIVGAGQVGTALSQKLEALGVDYLLCDPPLAESGDRRAFVDMPDIMACDIISLHVPLIETGPYPTRHLFDGTLLASLDQQQLLINACRGEVVDNQALLDLCRAGSQPLLVMDVWENEPDICAELVPYTQLGTAHIAGHTLEGKARGTEILYQHLAGLLNKPVVHKLADFLPKPDVSELALQRSLPSQQALGELVFAIYDIRRDDADFRARVTTPGQFEYIRKHYAIRREFACAAVSTGNSAMTEAILGLGFSVYTS
ncbi:4-phosphoerythronate dehydrogenase [Lacimicrobium alkaliphilum]|uniref:Erythronate-4-phosphate dehydrogenase n=1 Tax=Lacimicrobium alkaliphilum TaxID=1526571 RepID=A0A0U3B7U1_9ALTE|nr:4-phosphoerythronate dehydrogenase [Lacimicrobium alkaliphilum]ALS97717.1 erythronate-4-phosphate dehydrogenase [Lacimicrobium alkaliphilum]